MSRGNAFRPVPAEAALALEAEARRIERELLQRATCGNLADRDVAYGIARVASQRLYVPLGHRTAAKWAVALGFVDSEGHARDMVAMVKRLERLPKIRATFDAGELTWTKARDLSRHAEPEDEEEWLARRHESSEKLARRARATRGEPDTIKKTVEATPEEWAIIEAALDAQRDAARKAKETISLGQALARACRAQAGRGARTKIVQYHCQGCGEATMQTREGPAPLSPGAIDASYCDAELVDVTGDPKPVKRTIPDKVREFVLARAKYRCQAPGCDGPADHVHHDGGWRQGHDPRRMRALCWTHHRGVHDELVSITCTPDGGVAMTTPSGVPVEPRAPAPGVTEDAAKALMSLELSASEAKALVRRAVSALTGRHEPLTAESVVREALMLVPTPGVRSVG